MLAFLSALTLVAAPPPPRIADTEPTVRLARFSHTAGVAKVLEAAKGCGFETAELTENPTYRDLYVEKPNFADEKSDCLMAWIAAQPDVEMVEPPPPAGEAVDQLKEDARKQLSENGLLEGAPTLESTGSVEALAPAMEQHCGVEVGSVIKVHGDTLSFDPDDPNSFSDYEKNICLLQVLVLSGATKYGFVGNEKVEAKSE